MGSINIRIILFLCLISSSTFAQKALDTKIIVTVSDSVGLYEKIRLGFVNAEFIVKDDRKKDTLSTYPLNVSSTTYIRVYAAINGNTATFWGFMANSHGNYVGATVLPSKTNYTPIFYYKKDRYWNTLLTLAENLQGAISYGK